MLIHFDLKQLNEILKDFYEVTSLTVSLWDAENNQLAYYPKNIPRFCELIKSTPEGAAACLQSDIEVCKLSYQKKAPVFHYCHAGLVDVATPILYNDILLGYMMFGQVMDKNANLTSFDYIEKCSKSYRLDKEELQDAYSKLIFFNKSTVHSAMHILRICTYYLWISQMISPEKNFLICNLENYLNENLQQNITVENICDKFKISKNKLYRLSKDFFGKPFYQYLTEKRINNAKNMLESTDDPIYLICTKIGIPDYNYFSKVFKNNVGVTPREYRKSVSKNNPPN